MANGWDMAIAVLATGAVAGPALSRSAGRTHTGEPRSGIETAGENLCWCNGFVARLLFWATRNCRAASPRAGLEAMTAEPDHS